MKKFATITALLLCAAMMTGCSNGNTSGFDGASSVSEKSITERTSEVLSTVNLPEMSEVTADKLPIYYKIAEEDVTEFSAYVAGAGAYPDEFGIFVAVDAAKAEEIKTKLEERIEKQMNTYRDYSPDEMYKFDDCVVEVDGKTVIFAVTDDNDTAEDILD